MHNVHYLIYDSSDDADRKIDNREFDEEFVEVFILEDDTNNHKVFISFRLKKDGTSSMKFTGSIHTGTISSVICQYEKTKYKKINYPGIKRRRLGRCLIECLTKLTNGDFEDLMFQSFMPYDVLESSICLNKTTEGDNSKIVSKVTGIITNFITNFSDLV